MLPIFQTTMNYTLVTLVRRYMCQGLSKKIITEGFKNSNISCLNAHVNCGVTSPCSTVRSNGSNIYILCRLKLIWLEFFNNLQLPKMPGKFQHDQFLVDKFGNIMLTYIMFLDFIFIITRFSLINLPSFPDCMIV